MSTIIKTEELTKFYKNTSVPAIDKLNLEIFSGEIYGFLGANGAGKTTTLRILLNFISPTSGTAHIFDLDSVTDSVNIKKQIGYLSGDIALYDQLTGQQLFNFLGSIQKPNNQYLTTLIKRFNAEIDKPIKNLSKGNKQKIGIIQAFMHQPSLVILDEPTSGLDPIMQEAFYETLSENKHNGMTILMSSHNLAETQRICDRIGILRSGKLVHSQDIKIDNDIIKINFEITFSKTAHLEALKKDNRVVFISQKDNYIATFTTKNTISAFLKIISYYDILDIKTESFDLENEFLSYYQDKT